MLPITFMFNEGARIRVCFVLCALTFFGVGLSTLYLAVIRILSASTSAYTSLVEGYDGNYIVSVLTWLSSFAIAFNVLGLKVSFVAMYPERRAQMQVKMLLMTLAQLCLVVTFAWCSVICYIYASHVEESFKVSPRALCVRACALRAYSARLAYNYTILLGFDFDSTAVRRCSTAYRRSSRSQ